MIKRFLICVPDAWRGIIFAFRNEVNFRLELFFGFIILTTLFFLKGKKEDFIFVLIAISMVLIAELFNTAIEKLVDLIKSEKHYLAGIIKDVSAGFVLISVIFAFFIGVLVFYPLIKINFF